MVFTDYDNLHNVLSYKSDFTYIAEVKIPDSDCAIVTINSSNNYYECCKFKTNQIILTNCVLIDDFDQMTDLLLKNPLLLKFAKPELQTFEICSKAIKLDILEFNNIKPNNPMTINEIKQLYCIMQSLDQFYIGKIDKHLQTYEMCLFAVKYNYKNLLYVRHDLHTIELYMSIDHNGKKQMFQYMQKHLQTEELCEIVLKADPMLLKHVNCILFNKMSRIALEKNGMALKYINPDSMDFETLEIAVKSNNDAIQYVNPEFKHKFYNYGYWLFGLKSKYKKSKSFCVNID